MVDLTVTAYIAHPIKLIELLSRSPHSYDVRCPRCQTAPELPHLAGFSCSSAGRWFGTRKEREQLPSVIVQDSVIETIVEDIKAPGQPTPFQ